MKIIFLFLVLQSCNVLAIKPYRLQAATVVSNQKCAAMPQTNVVVNDLFGKPEYKIMYQWYRHNKDYTQGFKALDSGIILESTGEYGKSRIQVLNINDCTGQVERSTNTKKLKTKYFGEGTDLIKLNDNVRYIFQLTWKERVILVYSYPDMKQLAKIELPSQIKEGWGFTHDRVSGNIYITDGSPKVFTCRARHVGSKFSIKCDNGKIVRSGQIVESMLNELEFKGDILYMNIYQKNRIIALNVKTWTVIQSYDMTYLRQIANQRMMKIYHKKLQYQECLNGITWNSQKKCWMVTGKDWPVVYCQNWMK